MATFRATYSSVEDRAAGTGEAIMAIKGRGAQGMTPLTTSASAQDPAPGVVTMRCDGAVWVSIAASPTAAAGDKISVIDA